MAIDDKKLTEYLIFNEGVRRKRYYDSRGFPTIGVGFNLDRAGAREEIASVGADYDRIRSGKDSLSESQITALLTSDAKAAIEAARSLFHDFDAYDLTRQMVLADLVFNLGEVKLSDFRSFISAVKANDWDRAAGALRKSKWFTEVGKRAVRNVEAIRTGVLPSIAL